MITLTDAYKYYRKKYKKGTGELLGLREFKDINYAYNKKVVQKVSEGRTIHLPKRFGSISVKLREVNFEKPSVNFNETKKLRLAGDDKTVIYHFNQHSNNLEGRFKWKKIPKSISNLRFYSFRASEGQKTGAKSILSRIMFKKDGYKRFSK